MTFQVTNKDIGRILYPVDNSYSQDLTTGKRPDIGNGVALAGNYNTLAVGVKIVFIIPQLTVPNHIFDDKTPVATVTHEFVIVKYKEKLYLVLNYFDTEPPELDWHLESY